MTYNVTSDKIVLFTQRVEVVESYNERRDCADQRISEFILACGFLPVPLANNVACAEALVEKLKPCGIILTGGNSLVEYGGNAPERDEVDSKLIEMAMQKRIPLYGFCRGMQSVLDYFGAKLEQVVEHVAVRHDIDGVINENVNSYHNQACRNIGEAVPLQILAKAQDGVIEAVQHKKLPVLGTMWHPERENPFRSADIERVKKLFGGTKL